MKKIPVPAGLETRCFLLDRDVLAEVPALLREIFPGRRPWVIADENTWRAAGEKLQRILEDSGAVPAEPFLYPGTPVLHAEYAHVEPLRKRLPAGAVPVAVGGGTVNDIVKRMSGEAGVAYCCVPTAPSVDGYSSSGAAMVKDGLKQTLKCPAPLAIAADLEVLRGAPEEMKASGYADLLAKVPAGAEWLIADALGIEAVDARVWELLQKPLRKWVSDPADFGNVFHGLAASGYAMQLYNESRPASGMEHLCSHVWEMEGVEASHGFKVAAGTLASVWLMERFFALSREELRGMMAPPKTREERLNEARKLLRAGCYGNAEEVAMAKFAEAGAILKRREEILDRWEILRRRVREQVPSFAEIREMLARAGCPTTPWEIGLDRETFLHGVRTAGLIRRRYTMLDVLEECGVTDPMLAEMDRAFSKL